MYGIISHKRISEIGKFQIKDITKISFQYNNPAADRGGTVEDKEKIKEFMEYINNCVVAKKKIQTPMTGYNQMAGLYIGNKEAMSILFYNNFIEINGIQYNMVKNKLSSEKIDDFIKSAAFYDPLIQYISLMTDSKDLKEISNQIMSKYLDEYKKDRVAKELRIADFTINKIDDIQGNADKFNFFADYSERPADMNSYCLAGNGIIKGDWFLNRTSFVYVEKVNNVYRITNMGTGR
ncbi:MAG: hypothetical protein LIR50_15775 [Bacillota bacterium]|nr:hypothetical protein [Bacillota bacterium]